MILKLIQYFNECKHKEIITNIIILFIIFVISYFFQSIPVDNVIYKIYNILGLQVFLGTHMIKETMFGLWSSLRPYVAKHKYEYVLDNYMILINEKKIEKYYLYKINDIIIDIKWYVNEIKLYPKCEKDYNIRVDALFKILDFIMILTVHNKKIEIDLENTIKKLEQFINNYDSKEDLKETILIPLLQNLNDNTNKNKNMTINPIFIYGPSGTGKTKFVKDLSEILEISMLKYEKVESAYFDYSKGIEFEKILTFTKLVYESKKNKNHDYCILFIDEIDKHLFNNKEINNCFFISLLEWLDVNTKTIYDSYLKSEISIENVIIICASNKSLDEICNINKIFEPLKSRFTEIKIGKISHEIKLNIIRNNIKDSIGSIEKHEDFINKIVELSTDDGIRELLKISGKYINKINSIDTFKKTIWNFENILEIQDKIIKKEFHIEKDIEKDKDIKI